MKIRLLSDLAGQCKRTRAKAKDVMQTQTLSYSSSDQAENFNAKGAKARGNIFTLHPFANSFASFALKVFICPSSRHQQPAHAHSRNHLRPSKEKPQRPRGRLARPNGPRESVPVSDGCASRLPVVRECFQCACSRARSR